LDAAASGALAPDGDADLADELVASFEIVACEACGGALMPDVVFFGGSVPRPIVDRAFTLLDRAEALLVVGSSLAVFSGFRFVKKAAERGLPVAILNRGPTRGDPHAAVRLDARAGLALPALVQALRPPRAAIVEAANTTPARTLRRE
jgi:NAD+-dependent protein deacetylase sirtuin 4